MSGFALSGQQREFVRRVREVAESELVARAAAGIPGRVNRELLAAMGEHGLLRRLYGQDEAGGGAATRAAAMDLCLLRETLATVSTDAETAQFVVDAAVQLVGARALQRGHVLEHLYRDVRAPRIYEGASDIQRSIIGRSLSRSSP
jgi:alkylation response protein AidB-like acyl-CoA dehydrogenase